MRFSSKQENGPPCLYVRLGELFALYVQEVRFGWHGQDEAVLPRELPLSAGERMAQYLAEAQKFEERAANATNSQMQAQWLRIAESYRRLAQFAESN